jgi:outer membrane protein TolC
MRFILILHAVLVLCATTASADVVQVTLKEAISRALESDHRLKAVGLERTLATEETAIVRSRYLPRLTAEETAVFTNSATQLFMMKLDEGRFSLDGNLNRPSAAGNFRTAVTLEQPLFDAGIGVGVAAAQVEEQLRGHALSREREEVVFQVYVACLVVQQAKARLGVTERAVADAGEHHRLAVVRSASGLGLKADELRTRTFLKERELERLSARNDLRVAQLRLARAVGNGVGTSVDLREDLRAPAVSLSLDDLVRVALTTRPELKEETARVEKAGEGVRLATSSYLPTLSGSATYQMNSRDLPFGRDNDAWGVGATLRWELFDGLRRYHGINKARTEQNAARENLEKRREEIALEVEENWLRRGEAGERVDVLRHALLDAEEGVRLVKARYENSLVTLVDLLDAQTLLDRNRRESSDAETAFALATARLYQAAGILLQEVLK